MHTACVWSEKLPFAEYSVVKESNRQLWRLGDFASWRIQISNSPTHQLTNFRTGGEYRSRTGDLLVANQALSQLS
jgi:hypothetical protein